MSTRAENTFSDKDRTLVGKGRGSTSEGWQGSGGMGEGKTTGLQVAFT